MSNEIMAFKNDLDLASFLNKNYLTQIKNFFSDESKALKFLSSVRSDVMRNPKLLECSPMSIVNSYMTMAQLGFMPSNVSGESYVLPYNSNAGMQAQFQLGYQGLVTLFYQSGVEKVTSDIVRKNDKTSFINGELSHEIDLTKSNAQRGEPVGAYVTITFKGVKNTKYMNAVDILAHGKKFSKSFNLTGQYSPWNPANDPELHMWRKTVLKQLAKNIPKNEIINKAISMDNQDSIIADRVEAALAESKKLELGNNLIPPPNENNNKKEEGNKAGKKDSNEPGSTESNEINPFAKDGK